MGYVGEQKKSRADSVLANLSRRLQSADTGHSSAPCALFMGTIWTGLRGMRRLVVDSNGVVSVIEITVFCPTRDAAHERDGVTIADGYTGLSCGVLRS